MKRILIIFLVVHSCWPAEWYASPTGSSSAAGTLAAPVNLLCILLSGTGKCSNVTVSPGDTIWLVCPSGAFSTPTPAATNGWFPSTIDGTVGAPIIARSYPGYLCQINAWDGSNNAGNLNHSVLYLLASDYLYFRDVEITDTDPSGRAIDVPGSNPPFRRGGGIELGKSGRIINSVIHDTGNGVSDFLDCVTTETQVYGTTIYYNGWIGTDRQNGIGIYGHNDSQGVTCSHNWKQNVLFSPVNGNIQAYSRYGDAFKFIANANIRGEFLVSFDAKPTNILFQRNSIYRLRFGSAFAGTIDSNVFTGSFLFDPPDAVTTFTNNLVLTAWVPNPSDGQYWWRVPVDTRSNLVASNNRYYQLSTGSGNAFSWSVPGGFESYNNTFTQWKALNSTFDNSLSTFTASILPATNEVLVDANEYEAGRGIVVVHNFTGASSQSVDLSTILRVGDPYQISDHQNPLAGPIATGTYAGGNVSISLTSTSAPTFIGSYTGRCYMSGASCQASCVDTAVWQGGSGDPTGTPSPSNAVYMVAGTRRVWYGYGGQWYDSEGVCNIITPSIPTRSTATELQVFLVQRLQTWTSTTTATVLAASAPTIQTGNQMGDGSILWNQTPAPTVALASGAATASAILKPSGKSFYRWCYSTTNCGIPMQMN